MRELIANLTGQITEAISIGKSAKFNAPSKKINSILVCGLGGSGIGGKIISQLFQDELTVPFLVSNDYVLPSWVNENTLVIASSYSGNTEETIYAVKDCIKRNAEVAVITSGGELHNMAIQNNWNHAVVPGGQQPRAMLAYSLVQQVFLLSRYQLIDKKNITELDELADFIGKEADRIQEEAKLIAKQIHGKTPIIYCAAGNEGLAIRFRQQLNENAKVLCWHHVLPEMTHNELVGWAGGTKDLAAIYLKANYDHERTAYRWNICADVIRKRTDTILTIDSAGITRLKQNFYFIHLTDWISIYLADLKQVDPVEVDIIGHLKSEMSKKA